MLNGLLRRSNVDVYVTGSNSKLLSTDVMTEFRGRGDEVRIQPLTFSEFMQAFDGDRYDGWAEYVMYGGMPFLRTMRTDEQKVCYLQSLLSEVYLTDVVGRNRLEKTEGLDNLVDVLASSVGSLTNPSKIEATFHSVLRSSLDQKTIKKYIGYLEDAFVISEARRYDIKGRAGTSVAPRSITSRTWACAAPVWASGRLRRPASWRTPSTTSRGIAALPLTWATSRGGCV